MAFNMQGNEQISAENDVNLRKNVRLKRMMLVTNSVIAVSLYSFLTLPGLCASEGKQKGELCYAMVKICGELANFLSCRSEL